MAINIKQEGNKWKLGISEEVWQFDSRAEMEKCLKTLLDIKEKKGRINH